MHNIEKRFNLKENCKSYMAEKGLTFDGDLITDAKIHRYSSNNNKHKKDEWYIAYEGTSSQGNHFLNVVFASWKDGIKHTYKSFDQDTSVNDDERAELKEIARLNILKTENNIRENQEKAAKSAQSFWEQCSITPSTNDYLQYISVKGIEPSNTVRFSNNLQGYPSLVIPLYNNEDELRSLQFISMEEGKTCKKFFPGGEKKGNYHLIGNLTDDKHVMFIGEGYATCASIYEAIKKPTIVAFDAGNISVVLDNLKKRFPQRIFIVAADNDEIGTMKAHDAINKFNDCSFVIPEFPNQKKQDATDFNDLAQIAGIDEVREQLIQAYAKSEAGKRVAREHFLSDNDPCKKFELKKFPTPLREYISSIQKTTNAHPIIITASVISMMSGYLGTKVFIPEGEYFQTLYSNLWILCIANSGQFKTTALNKGAKLAYDLQTQILAQIKELQTGSQQQSSLTEEQLNKSRENIILPTKITAEALLEYLAQEHKGVIFASEFGGWLQNLDKTHNNDFKAIMTELYDVPTCYRYKTKTQGDCILKKPFISICGVSTASWIQENMKLSDIPSGFFARLIILTPPSNDKIPPALPFRQAVSDENQEMTFKMYIDRIITSIGEERSFSLTPDARRIFHSYHILIYCAARACNDKTIKLIQPYLKRWSPALLKIAMIMQLFIDHNSIEISGDAIIKAFHFLNPAIKSTIGFLEQEFGESHHQRKCRTLINWISKRIQDKKTVTRQTILTSKQFDGGAKEYDPILSELVDQGKLICKEGKKKKDDEYYIIDEPENN